MERSHSLEFQAVRAAPFKKLPASPGVSSASVPVADRGGEEVNIGFSDLRRRGEGSFLVYDLTRLVKAWGQAAISSGTE